MTDDQEAKKAIPSGEKEETPHTPEDFIVKWPLYTPFDFRDFSPPTRISFHCDGECGKETTWVLKDDPSYQSLEAVNKRFCWVYYVCNRCEKEFVAIIYVTLKYGQKTGGRSRSGEEVIRSVPNVVQKIGQYPALTIDIPKSLEKSLGENATILYKKALVSRNQGYGMAAVAYIRRVVEDKTDDLIEVVAKLAESHDVDPKTVEAVRAAITQRTTYDNKLRIASTVMPKSLVPDGANPLGVLYDLVSQGIHDLSEEQCIAVADETKSVFEFTFTNLRAETKARNDFIATVKKLTTGKVPGAAS
jgi:hypothetical protein